MNSNANVTLDSFSNARVAAYAVNSHAIRRYIDQLINGDTDKLTADYRARSYYLGRKPLMWIDRHGIDHRADILVRHLRTVGKLGFSEDRFMVGQIRKDLRSVRSLDFDTDAHNINKVLARLEYNLTKAYLRYVLGQRFGFFNPSYTMNRLDTNLNDTSHVSFRTLFSIKMQRPSKEFYELSLRKVHDDSVGFFLNDIQPRGKMYSQLYQMLNSDGTPSSLKTMIMCNMERCRWRLFDYPYMHDKYVLVNIPSYHLLAMDNGRALTMKIICGTFDTKTPLLTSKIKRMDINPQWILPRSIIRKDIVRHVGDTGYFDRMRFFVRERKTGRKVDVDKVSRADLLGGKYIVIQEGGEGNSLGRIIFRFDNPFSVFIHDTSYRDMFNRGNRDVSHGCVRVSDPFGLAVYMLDSKDDDVVGKIWYSMNADVSGIGIGKGRAMTGKPMVRLDRSKLIGHVAVEPQIPVFITYFTMYPGVNGTFEKYPDIYGYDHVIYNSLKNYI